MKKIIYILTLLFLVSCYEDKGNYDYSEISNITIGDIKEEYTSQKYLTLELTPSIKTDGVDEKNLKYTWEVNGKIVSNEKKLDYNVEESFRDEPYFCRLTVVNTLNEAKYYKSFKLRVVTPFHIGLMILSKNRDNEAIFSYAPIVNDIPQEVIPDVFTKENGKKLEGKPISLEEADSYDYVGDLFINTSKGGYCIGTGLMREIALYGENKLLEPEPSFEVKGISFRNYDYYTYGAVVGTNGKIYPINGDNKYFSLPSLDPCPVKSTDKFISDYDLSEYFIARTVGWGSRGGFLAYDNKMGRYIDFRSELSAMDTEQMASAYERDTLGSKMFYMALSNESGFMHTSLLHSGNFDGWRIVPSHNNTFAKNPSVYNVGTNYLNSKSKVIIGINYSILYYSSGGKIYMIYLTDTSKKFDSQELVIEGLSNEQITMLRFKDYKEQTIYVGVEKDDYKGKVYEIDMQSKKVINIYENIDGIPVDVAYKKQ